MAKHWDSFLSYCMPAMKEQIKAKEAKIMDYDKQEYLAQHVILSTTLTCLGSKIKNLKMAKEIWDMVKADATTKSTLFLLDAENQLASMKLADNTDPKTHLSELKEHFQLMMHWHNYLEDGIYSIWFVFQYHHYVITAWILLPITPDHCSSWTY